jgi:hypothetical protein
VSRLSIKYGSFDVSTLYAPTACYRDSFAFAFTFTPYMIREGGEATKFQTCFQEVTDFCQGFSSLSLRNRSNSHLALRSRRVEL